MNGYQSPKIAPTVAQRIPASELRPGMLVALAADSPESGKLPTVAGQLAGGTYCPVVSVTHAPDDELRVVVKHSRATHPSGGQAFYVPLVSRVVIRRPEGSVVADARPTGAAQ